MASPGLEMWEKLVWISRVFYEYTYAFRVKELAVFFMRRDLCISTLQNNDVNILKIGILTANAIHNACMA